MEVRRATERTYHWRSFFFSKPLLTQCYL